MLKEKLRNVRKYLIPFRYFNEDKTFPVGYYTNFAYSMALLLGLSYYITMAIGTKSLNPKEQLRIINEDYKISEQKNKIEKQESEIRNRLYSFIDKNGDGEHILDELIDFCEKNEVNPNKFSCDSLDSWRLEELEKVAQKSQKDILIRIHRSLSQ